MKKNNFIIFVILLMSISLYGNSQKISLSFKKRFDMFKTALIHKDAHTLYEMELPYFRYLNTFDAYKYYINAHAEVENIIITKILKKNNENIDIMIGLKLKNRKNMVYLEQNWYKVRNNFYFLTKNKFIFKY